MTTADVSQFKIYNSNSLNTSKSLKEDYKMKAKSIPLFQIPDQIRWTHRTIKDFKRSLYTPK